ncbi:MAG: hypothetical protein ACYDHD_00060 [Vulcanimicrobiaceae bacterium]
MQKTSLPATDIRSQDGRHLRRGYLELELNLYTGPEIPDHAKDKLALLLQGIVLEHGRERVNDYYVFATTLDPNASAEDSMRAIVGFVNKLTEDYGVSAFTADLSLYDDELEKFREFAEIATPEMFAQIA